MGVEWSDSHPARSGLGAVARPVPTGSKWEELFGIVAVAAWERWGGVATGICRLRFSEGRNPVEGSDEYRCRI